MSTKSMGFAPDRFSTGRAVNEATRLQSVMAQGAQLERRRLQRNNTPTVNFGDENITAHLVMSVDQDPYT